MNTTQTTPKTFSIKVYENWYGSLERAHITLTTPKGTSLRIDKWPRRVDKNKWDATEEGRKFVWDIYGRIYTGAFETAVYHGVIQMTKEEVELWKSYSDKQHLNLVKK